MKNRTPLIGVAFLFIFAGNCYADDTPTSLQQLNQSSELADYGRKNNNAAALVIAAQMRRELAIEQRKNTLLGHAPQPIPMADSAKLPSVDSLLSEARAMAHGDTTINILADNVASTSEKGRERGPLYEIINVSGGKTEQLKEMAFNLDKRVEIYVEGTENLSLLVQDNNGHSICRDDRNKNIAYCWWPQASASSVTIEVSNKSKNMNTIRLVTN